MRVRCKVNGVIKQDGCTAQMMFSVDQLICYITQCVTLYPGDIIFTGIPAGVSPTVPGDVTEVEISGIEILRNKII